jgi:cytochrome P450
MKATEEIATCNHIHCKFTSTYLLWSWSKQGPIKREMLEIVFGLFVCACAYVFYYYYYVLLRERKFFADQGIKCTPFQFWYGDQQEVKSYALLGKMQVWDGDKRDQLGAKTYINSFGIINRLTVLDTNLLRSIFGNRAGSSFNKSPMTAALLEPLLGMQGLFLLENPHHKKYRGLINPAFHFSKLSIMAEVMIKTCQKVYRSWNAKIQNEIRSELKTESAGWHKWEMHEAWNSLGLEIIVGTVLGANFEDAETQQVMYNTFSTLVAAILKRFINMTSVLPVIKHLPLPSKRFVDAGVARARGVVRAIIDQRRAGKSRAMCEGEDLLDILLKVRDDAGAALSTQQILDQTMTFVFAGHEPTANLLTWAMWCLTHHPETLAKCQLEVDSVLGKEPPSTGRLKDLKYLTAFLNEVLRMYPPAPTIRRKAKEDFVYTNPDGSTLSIPRGTEIHTNFFAIHRDPDYWTEPDVFKPERFLMQPSEPGVRKAFYPFGLGPRVCIGQTFALLETKIMLAMFLQNFEIKLVPGQKFLVDMKITMHPRHGVFVYARPRDLPETYFNQKVEISVGDAEI